MSDDFCKRWQQVAVIDGQDEHAEVYLGLEAEDDWQDLPWPDDWPSWVSADFLRSKGFDVRTA